jgi:hypothetical protein
MAATNLPILFSSYLYSYTYFIMRFPTISAPRPIAYLFAILLCPILIHAQTLKQYKFSTGDATSGMVLKSIQTNAENTILLIEYDLKQAGTETKELTISKKTFLNATANKEQYKLLKSDFVPLCPKKYTNEFKDNIITYKLYFPAIQDKAGKEFDLVEEDPCNKAKGGFKISGIKLAEFTETNDAEYYINNPDKIVKIKKVHQPVFVTAVCKILKSSINDDFKSVTGQVKGGNESVSQCFSTVGMPTCKPQNNIVAVYGNGKKEYYGAFWAQKDTTLDFSLFMMDSLKSLLEPILLSDYVVLDVPTNAYEKMYIFARKDDNKAADIEQQESQFPNITISLLRNKHNVAIMIGRTLFSYEKKSE